MHNPVYRNHFLLARLRAALPTVECLINGTTIRWGATPSADEQSQANAIVAEVLAAFPDPLVTDSQWAAWEADAPVRAIDAVPDAVLDLILAARALPPTATAADVRARAKADRRARGGRP
jgi:hypothetical protein